MFDTICISEGSKYEIAEYLSALFHDINFMP